MTVVSPNATTSPVTGKTAAFFFVEVLERAPSGLETWLGSVIFGDLVTLAPRDVAPGDRPTEITLVARQATFELVDRPLAPVPIVTALAELVPMMRRASGRGALYHCEHAVRTGDSLRLRAVVEATAGAVGAGVRSSIGSRLVARHDLGLVTLDQVLLPVR